jgi:hypothetical protein
MIEIQNPRAPSEVAGLPEHAGVMNAGQPGLASTSKAGLPVWVRMDCQYE